MLRLERPVVVRGIGKWLFIAKSTFISQKILGKMLSFDCSTIWEVQ
jgi:hypothetical protein